MAHFKPGEPRTRKREEAELLFPTIKEVLDLHKQTIEEFGGAHGLRDEAALESAIMAVENRAYYENASLAICAATYAYHLTQAHAFIDGNKRRRQQTYRRRRRGTIFIHQRREARTQQ